MIIPELLRNSPWRSNPEIDRLARLLIPPLVPNHQPGHPALGEVWARELEQSAKAFEFDSVTVTAAYDLVRDERAAWGCLQQCEPPSKICFFEFPAADTQFGNFAYGHFTEGNRHRCTVTTVCTAEGNTIALPIRRIVFSFAERRTFAEHHFECWTRPPGGWVTPDRSPSGAPPLGNEFGTVWSIIALWSFLTTPGVATVKQAITRAGRKAQRRGRFTLSAIHSYNIVTLNLPRDIREGGRPIHFEPGPGKRFHDVMAFDRLKRAPPPGSPPLLRWLYAWWFGRVRVRAHHRGNPALGTVFKQRQVRARWLA